jgi:hypothetical protein
MAIKFECGLPEEEVGNLRLGFDVGLRMDGDPSVLLRSVEVLGRIVDENPDDRKEWVWGAAPCISDDGRTVEFRFDSTRHFLIDRIVSDLLALSELEAGFRALLHATDMNPFLDQTNWMFVLVSDGGVRDVDSCAGFTFDEALVVFDLGERVTLELFAKGVSAIVKRIDDLSWYGGVPIEGESFLLSVVGGSLAAALKESWPGLPPIEEGDAVSIALADLDLRFPVVAETLRHTHGTAVEGLLFMESACAELVMLAGTKKTSGVVSMAGGGGLSI